LFFRKTESYWSIYTTIAAPMQRKIRLFIAAFCVSGCKKPESTENMQKTKRELDNMTNYEKTSL